MSKRLRFWLMMAGVFIALAGFGEIVDDVFHDPLEGDVETQTFDREIGQAMRKFRSPLLNQAMTDVTALGSVSVLSILFLILISVLATFRDFRGIAYLCAVGVGAASWPPLLKSLFGRERPVDVERLVRVTDLSFPSGHAFASAAVYIALAYYGGQYARSWNQEVFFHLLGGFVILIIGFSRIYLGAHFPTDVLAGLCGGAAWGLLVSACYEWIHPTRRAARN